MTSRLEFGIIEAVYNHFGEPLPADIGNAVDALRAATDARTHAHQETEPPIDVSSAKAVATSIDTITQYRATAEHRRSVADAVERAASYAELATWESHAPEYHDKMRRWFGATAKKFLDVLARLDGCTDISTNVSQGRGELHAHADELASTLTLIRNARSALHGRLSPVDTPFWKWTQIVAVPDTSTTQYLDGAVRGKGLTPDPDEGSSAWWAQLATYPGVTLEYHDPSEQHTLHATLPSAAPQPAAV